MKKFFSISLMAKKLGLLVARFPISILLVAGHAYLLFVEINGQKTEIPYQLLIFFSLGAVISATATLWLENVVNCLKQYIITVVVVLLWGVYCFFLPDKDNIQTNKIIEIVVIGTVAFLSLFFISFLKKDKDKAYWNFTIQTIFHFGLAVLFAGIIFGGLCLAVLAIDELFKISINDNVYEHLAVICFILFASLYFLANIPDKIAKHNEEITLNKFLKVLTLYILIPLAAVYIVILYAYLFKIIFHWELPDGRISWMVSVLASGGLLIITLLYPARLDGKNKIVVFLSRYFGLIILPLLILMTIGIFRRIGDYGITIHRCYVLILNIWFYGIYAYLFIIKSQRIKWILISPTLIALFVSFGFWSVPNITKRILTAELNNYLDNKKIDISDKTFFADMEQKNKEKIREKIRYLYHTYGKESVQQFFSDTIRGELGYYTYLDEPYFTDEDKSEWVSFSDKYNKIWHTDKFSCFVHIDYASYRNQDQHYSKEIKTSYIDDGQLEINIVNNNQVFYIPLKEIMINQMKNKADEISYSSKDYIIFIKEFCGNYYKTKDSLSIDDFGGYLFYNK